jgi:hypothetical protein
LAVSQPSITFAVLLASVLTIAFPAYSSDTLNSIEVPGDHAYPEPTAVAKVGETAWVAEGQLSHLFNPATNGPPRLPFRITGVPVGP